MSQATVVIADGSGATVLNEINAANGALITNNSGASAPAITYPYMLWADTGTGLLKLRNGANTSWQIIGMLDAPSYMGNYSAGAFMPHQAGTPNMTLVMDGGTITANGRQPLVKTVQTSAARTAPVTNPRIDRAYIDYDTGTLTFATGAEAVSPIEPALPVRCFPICRIAMTVGMTTITNSIITDERGSFINPEPAPGSTIMFDGPIIPGGYLRCDGTAVSRATYADLYAALNKTATVTMTIASPCVVSWASHGLVAGIPVKFSTTGALPTGLVAGTTYYVSATGLAAGTFRVSATPGGATINTSGSQSGTHTGICSPWGNGDGSTTFNLPFWSGRAPIGSGAGTALTERALGDKDGEETHLLTIAEMPQHNHPGSTVLVTDNLGGSQEIAISNNSSGAPVTKSVSVVYEGGNNPHNVMQPYGVTNFIIKY
jgi:microcystin-dependent protein